MSTATSASHAANTATNNATDTLIADQSPGLSTGAKAGIGVGAAVGVLAVLTLGALLLKRQRRTIKSQPEPSTEEKLYGIDSKQELDGAFQRASSVEDASPSVAELDAPVQPPGSASGRLATSGPWPLARAELSSREPSPNIPRRSDGSSELPGPAASREVKPSATNCQELAADARETKSTVPAPPEANLEAVDVEGEHDIQQQLIRLRNERARLTRIHELERMEADLQQRLGRSKETTAS